MLPNPESARPSSTTISPAAISAGLGLADRSEICGLLALLEVTSVVSLAKGAFDTVQSKLGRDLPDMATRLKARAAALGNGVAPTEALRHKLWFELTTALGIGPVLPLSSRKMRETAAAIGVKSAELLSPAVHTRQAAERAAANGESWGERLCNNLAETVNNPKSLFTSATVFSFPDIVGSEALAMLEGLKAQGISDQLDPEIQRAIEAGQGKAGLAAAAGGGWLIFAGVVQAAGFAPYILAAQISAFIPFIGGPAAVSLLAVLVNPVTLFAGLAALGYVGVMGKANQVRRLAAARVAVILALRGMLQEGEGVASLVTDFRRLTGLGPEALAHLTKEERASIRRRIARMEKRLLRALPPAVAVPPGVWANPVNIRTTADADLLAAGTLTLGDMLYHALAIDPKVLAAANFSRTLEIGDPIDFAANIGALLTEGARTSLRGYTAEQIVLARFVDQGHAVELPVASNTPGYDLLIDGVPVQVKCGMSLSNLTEHFEKYPDIPVVANSELAAQVGKLAPEHQALVSSFDGFDLPAVQEILDDAVAGGLGLSDVEVPIFAVLVGAGRGAYRAWKGDIPVEDLPAWLVIDLTIRGGLAAGGKVAGGYLGLLFVGPAGGIILAPLLGVAALAGTEGTRGILEKVVFRDWHASVLNKSDTLHRALQNALQRRSDALFTRARDIAAGTSLLSGDIASWAIARATDDAIAVEELLADLPKPKDLNGVLALVYLAARSTPTDAMVSRAKVAVVEELGRKPLLGTAMLGKVGVRAGRQ